MILKGFLLFYMIKFSFYSVSSYISLIELPCAPKYFYRKVPNVILQTKNQKELEIKF